MWDLIVSVPVHCLSFYLVSQHLCYLKTPSEITGWDKNFKNINNKHDHFNI